MNCRPQVVMVAWWKGEEFDTGERGRAGEPLTVEED